MDKNRFQKIPLSKGEMNVYDFGGIKLHAYKTNDYIDDEVFIVEKDGQAVVLEAPCFFDNESELEEYLQDNGLTVSGLLLAYHMAGGSLLPGVRVYATRNADEYGHSGGGRKLIDQFTHAFGAAFDSTIFAVTDYIEEGKATIGGIDFQITVTDEAYDIEIPEINAVYTHMLGHDCHSIVAGAGHADAIIRQLQGYIQKGVDLVLTSHYTPEDLKDVEAKIAYLEELKAIAAKTGSAEEFKAACRRKYPDYSGDNYLDMTAGFFFA